MKLNQYKYKMDTIFMNSENSKISYPHSVSLNLTNNRLENRCEYC